MFFKKGIANIVLIIVAAILVGSAAVFILRNNRNNALRPLPTLSPLVSPIPSPLASINASPAIENEVKLLITHFYQAIEKQDGALTFSYITPPVTSEEKKDYDWLTGADLPAGGYRVFWRVKISQPEIKKYVKISDTQYRIELTDQTQGYSNAGNEVGWQKPQTRKVVIQVVHVGGRWLIDKYTFDCGEAVCGGNAAAQKYSGLGQ